ncbi:hypothetical protein CYMTET_50172 [Cymbomonas tetramitiformis]|uniref:DNA mismatch repair proteins mutS family domain-containing protein n=1 Tax=Cymbomonas tetramitiformis TaxID=36881 RepID=A0AAE0ETE1_9CHLO|nr:hypothetical protein CYMTET_50172 [Cymbomonas tetramitiformis]
MEEAGLTFATTHSAEVKDLAIKSESFALAAVEFDIDRLEPTYRLQWGEVGNSNALDIAAGLGLPPSMLQEARRCMSEDLSEGNEAQRSGNLMASLERHLAEQRRRSSEAARACDDAQEELATARERKHEIDENGDELRAEIKATPIQIKEDAMTAFEAAIADVDRTVNDRQQDVS